MDISGGTNPNKHTAAAQQRSMPMVYDGWWMHNGKDERINARHSKNSKSNIVFFDGSAATFDTFRIPSVNDKFADDIKWRFSQ